VIRTWSMDGQMAGRIPRHNLFMLSDFRPWLSARPGEFGVRLEDHMVITETGARSFTEPAFSVDDPFGLE
jgi:hypothetical protein